MHRVQQEHNNYMHSKNFTCIVHVCSQEFRTLPITSIITLSCLLWARRCTYICFSQPVPKWMFISHRCRFSIWRSNYVSITSFIGRTLWISRTMETILSFFSFCYNKPQTLPLKYSYFAAQVLVSCSFCIPREFSYSFQQPQNLSLLLYSAFCCCKNLIASLRLEMFSEISLILASLTSCCTYFLFSLFSGCKHFLSWQFLWVTVVVVAGLKYRLRQRITIGTVIAQHKHTSK